jgi:hypothetical protein
MEDALRIRRLTFLLTGRLTHRGLTALEKHLQARIVAIRQPR